MMASSLGSWAPRTAVEDRPAGLGLELVVATADRPHRWRDGVPVGEVVVRTPVEDLLDDRVLPDPSRSP
jgi:hypothetical protein